MVRKELLILRWKIKARYGMQRFAEVCRRLQGFTEQPLVTSQPEKSLLRKFFDWEGASFVTLLMAGVAFLTIPHGYFTAKICFISAATVLVIKLALEIKTTLYPRIVIAVLASILAGIGVNYVNGWVTSLEIEEATKSTGRIVAVRDKSDEHGSTQFHPKPAPLIKGAAFSTVIPFIVEEDEAEIPYDSNRNDPLSRLYGELAGIGYIWLGPQMDQQSHTLTMPALSDTEIRNFLGRAVQYYILRSVDEMQNAITYIDYQTGKSLSSNTTSPVVVPDEKEYPKKQLDKLTKSLNIQFNTLSGRDDPVWKQYKLKVPSGTSIKFVEMPKERRTAYIVRLERKPDFHLNFEIVPGIRDRGFPQHFVPIQPTRIKDVYTYVCVISFDFQWNGDHVRGESYGDWAQGLFSGLQKKMKIPDRNQP